MAVDFIAFASGENQLIDASPNAGMPTMPMFALSTLAVANHATSIFNSASIGEITGTGYVRATLAAPVASGGNLQFAQASWGTLANTNWPAGVKSIVCLSSASTGSGASGVPYCAWNLIPGATPVDMSQANTTLNVTPLLTAGS